jgi:6-pyruvoyltetrahydropterin/6-carboxytetrahydropterin synthase
MVFITRRERFCAAHRLFNPNWTEERNASFYGGCANPNWHGHNYELWITFKGEINPELGFLVDLKILGSVIREQIISKLDHKNINLEVDFMKGKMVSTENMVIAIWGEIEPYLKRLGVDLHCVKLQETENNFVEYYGNQICNEKK